MRKIYLSHNELYEGRTKKVYIYNLYPNFIKI